MLSMIGRILRHPYCTALIGSGMMVSGLSEAARNLEEDVGLLEQGLRAHHGVSLYGLFLLLKALVEVAEGARRVSAVSSNGQEEASSGGE